MNLALLIVIILCILYFIQKKFSNTNKLCLTLNFPQIQIKIKGEIAMFEMSNTTYVNAQITPLNRLGGPAEVENVEWVIDNPELIELTPDPEDPKKCKVRAVGPVGVTTLRVSADVNLDPDVVETIEDFVGIEIKAANAVNLGLIPGEPIEQ